MSSYRFCRTDDVPLLVRAYNGCYRPHFPGLAPLTIDGFKAELRVLDLWASSCLLALEGDSPVGVLLAGKRDEANLIWRVGVHPDHVRRGHARHLLTSLSSKLAILGPPVLLAEVPEEWGAARLLFEACGYVPRSAYTDFRRPPQREEVAPHVLVFPVGSAELRQAGGLTPGPSRCWGRSARSILNRRAAVRGLAVAAGERIEASLLYHDAGTNGPREILDLECADPGRAETLLGLLVAQACGTTRREVSMAKVEPHEIDFDLLRSWGFEAGRETVGYRAEARAVSE